MRLIQAACNPNNQLKDMHLTVSADDWFPQSEKIGQSFIVHEKIQSMNQIVSSSIVRFSGTIRPLSQGLVIGFILWFCPALAVSQETDVQAVQQVQRELTLFGTLLEDALRLDESTSLFGMRLGGIESIYLTGQGAVLELRSPLANRRYRLGLAALSSTMQSLQLAASPIDSLQRDDRSPSQQNGNPPAEKGYRQLLERIANLDYSLVTQTAIQQATQSARVLRALGEVDDASFADLEEELAALSQTVKGQVEALRNLEQHVRASGNPYADAEASVDLDGELEQLLSSIEPLKRKALAKAAELRRQSEQAERDYAAAWQSDLEDFRELLYESVCEYGAGLTNLPIEENLSLVLKGLGGERKNQRRGDEIHILSNADIQACATGQINASTLAERALAYTW